MLKSTHSPGNGVLKSTHKSAEVKGKPNPLTYTLYYSGKGLEETKSTHPPAQVKGDTQIPIHSPGKDPFSHLADKAKQ